MALSRAPPAPGGANLARAGESLRYRLDGRLAGLVRSASSCYTRSADDLVFSGDRAFEGAIKRFAAHVGAIALEERFAVQTRKTRELRQGVRQRVAGVVVNARPNIPRDEYDALKTMLHNCKRHGPLGQDRVGHAAFRAHLAGQIAHVGMIHPTRGQRLRAMFDQIAW